MIVVGGDQLPFPGAVPPSFLSQGQMSCSPSLPSCLLRSLEEPWKAGAPLARGRSLLGEEAPQVSNLDR